MKKLIAVIALMLMSTVAFAQSINVDGLTEQQKAELALQAAKMKQTPTDPVSVSANVRQEAEAWGTMGANMGRAMVGAAKEVGVAANEFASTPLGKVTIGVVVYKLIGNDVIGWLVGSTILFVTFSLAIYIMIWFRWGARYTYEYKPKFWGLYQKRYVLSVQESDDATGGRMIAAAVLIVVGLVVGLNTIF